MKRDANVERSGHGWRFWFRTWVARQWCELQLFQGVRVLMIQRSYFPPGIPGGKFFFENWFHFGLRTRRGDAVSSGPSAKEDTA